MPQIELQNVTKYFVNDRKKRFAAVDDVSITIEQGDFVFLIGSSGAGKTTILKLIANQIRADSGRIWMGDQEVTKLRYWKRSAYRRMIGQVWQEAGLIRKKTIRENLYIVQRALGVKSKVAEENTTKALALVGMRAMGERYPFELSGGQIKLVELARAVICNPPVLVVDEITANLDYDTSWDIMNILAEINRCGTTVIMATHAKQFVNVMRKRVITLVEGRVVADVAKGKYGEFK